MGAEQARTSAELLADFKFEVPPSPVLPGENVLEPEPLGAKYSRIDPASPPYRFYAAWPVECGVMGAKEWSVWSEGKSEQAIIVSQSEQGGTAAVIGDTHFTSNENFDFDEIASTQFWRWLLSRVVPGQKAWNPPAGSQGAEEDKEETEEMAK